jgi:glycerate kinase
MRVLIAIDKFKESLTSVEAANIIQAGIKKIHPNYHTTVLPMADGGDGFADTLKFYLNTETVFVNSVNSLNNKIKAYYEWNGKNKTAIIELAVCSGLASIPVKKRNPLKTSTYGTGLLIQHAIQKGAKKIILGLGGSSTNDAGMGIAVALGFNFLDKLGNQLEPVGESLNKIATIIVPKKLPKISFEIASDVVNPLFGKNGAAYIYSPQKGASKAQVLLLDKGLKNIALIISKSTGKDISKLKGIGAAGGVAAMIVPYFPFSIKSGFQLIAHLSKLEKRLKKTDLLITGEGKIDLQSFQGKIVGSLIKYAKDLSLDLLLIAGKIANVSKTRISKYKVIELADDKNSIEYSIKNAKKILNNKVYNYFKS